MAVMARDEQHAARLVDGVIKDVIDLGHTPLIDVFESDLLNDNETIATTQPHKQLTVTPYKSEYVNLAHVPGAGWVFWDLRLENQDGYYGSYMTKEIAVIHAQQYCIELVLKKVF